MFKYKRLYKQAQADLEATKKELAEANQKIGKLTTINSALQTDNQRFVVEHNDMNEKLLAALSERDGLAVELREKAELVKKLNSIIGTKDQKITATMTELENYISKADAYIEGLKESARLTGMCEGCRFKSSFQKCASCLRNPRAVDKFEEIIAEEAVPDTAELIEGTAEVDIPDLSEGLPVEGAEPVENTYPDDAVIEEAESVTETSSSVIEADEPAPDAEPVAESDKDLKPVFKPKKAKKTYKGKKKK